jgi:iron complex outermembrane receptor protein
MTIRSAPTRLAFALCVAGLLGAGAVRAQETNAQDQAESEALQGLLAEQTDIATKTRENADYVPGIVSVLHADEAELLGARTVLDALSMVPGVEINRNERGAGVLRVRGIDFFFNAGNVKILVDSLPISREAAFQTSGILLMPIEQVDRIEVIRGPGSGIHGDFAFTGLVNIVTHHDRNAVSVTAGSGSRRSGVWSFATPDSGVRVNGTASFWNSDRYDGPGEGNADENRRYATLAIGQGGLSFKLAAIDRDFSRVAPAPPAPPGFPQPPPGTLVTIDQSERNVVSELHYEWQRGAENHGSVWFNYLDTDMQRSGSSGFRGSRWELGADGTWRVGRHLLFAQATLARPEISDAHDPNLPNPGHPPGLFGVEDSRQYASLSLQDQVDFGDRFSLTGGLRYDHLQGIDSMVSPRFSALWRINDRHLLKMQYAEGFRSPTYIEMFASGPIPADGIPFEKIDTLEGSYIYRTPNTVFRATVYHSLVYDLIFPRFTPLYNKGLGIRSHGVELEYTRQLRDWLKLMATFSRARSADERSTPPPGPVLLQPSLGEANWIGNVALIARANEHWSFGLQWNHIGDRDAYGTPEPGYDLVNLGATWKPGRTQNLQVRFGVHNALDHDIVYLGSFGPGVFAPFNYGKRQWSASLEWDF